MKVFINFILFFLILNNTLIADDFKLPFKKENLKAIYKIDDGNWIYIQSFERGDRIWERKKNSKEIIEISIVYNFIAIAEECEFIKQNNIYFAQNEDIFYAASSKEKLNLLISEISSSDSTSINKNLYEKLILKLDSLGIEDEQLIDGYDWGGG